MQLFFRACLALASLVLAASTIDVTAAFAARSLQMPHRHIIVPPDVRSYGDIRAHLPFVDPMPPATAAEGSLRGFAARMNPDHLTAERAPS